MQLIPVYEVLNNSGGIRRAQLMLWLRIRQFKWALADVIRGEL